MATTLTGPFSSIGTNSATYTPVAADAGKYIGAWATYDDGYDSGNTAMKVTDSAVSQLAVNGLEAPTYEENGTDAVGTYTASGGGAASISWSLSGDDADDFNISSGELTFNTSPDYEEPADADTNNVYMVTVVATNDVNNVAAELGVTITVTDVQDERPAVVQTYDIDKDGEDQPSRVVCCGRCLLRRRDQPSRVVCRHRCLLRVTQPTVGCQVFSWHPTQQMTLLCMRRGRISLGQKKGRGLCE